MKTPPTLGLILLLAAAGACPAPRPSAPAAPASGVMPDLAHAWSPVEIAIAAELASVQAPLPTFGTPDGKAFFDRLTAPNYFKALTDPKVPLKTRILQSADMFKANGHLLAAYGSAADQGRAGHAEVSTLVVQQLRFASVYAILANEVVATADATDARVASVTANLDKGFAALCTMALRTMREPSFLAPGELAYELQAMATTIVRMNVFFSAATRAALARELSALRPSLPSAADRQVVDRILQTLAA